MKREGPLQTEVCVVGGGPAGAACALRLAQLGHDVLLVERAPRGRPHVGESLTPAILPLLGELGVRRAVEHAGFLRPSGARVAWEGAPQDLADPGGEPGFQVDRGVFDALLLDAAADAGVRVLQPATALVHEAFDSHVEVPLRDGRSVQADWLVLAHGRRASPMQGAARTAALYAYFDEAGAFRDDPRTRVEAGASAWYWGAPLPDGSIDATVFVDADALAGRDALQRETMLRELLARSALLRPLSTARARTSAQVCDATPRCDSQPIAGRVVKVGEAAFAIDPLSSQGVQAAMRSAWQAAACVHTLARRPASSALATEFYRDQVRRASCRHARLAAGFHAAAAERFGTPFWQCRSQGPLEVPLPAPGALPALDDWVQLDARAVLQPVPALQGEFIVEASGLLHPWLDAPVCFAGATPIARLLGGLSKPLRTRELLGRWRDECGDEAAVRLLATLWRQGVMRMSG